MYKYTQEIRKFINKPRKQYNLLKNHKFWNQLCSSLDVIEDSDLAIDAYLNMEFSKDDGEKYLRLYGLLQALFLQQDSVINLCESLNFPDNLITNIKLREIRDIRNDSIGHPTKRGNYNSYHYISRVSITKSKFKLFSDYENSKTIIKDILVIDLIKEQRKYLSKILKKIIKVLKAEEKKHKEKFKMEKLEAVFPNTLSYYIEKIFENIGKLNCAKLGLKHIRLVKKVMDKLKDSLQKRGIEIDTYDSIKYHYELLEYPITELELYFDRSKAKEEPRINDKTARIFTWFIKEELHELKEIVIEIDSEYSI